MVFASFRGSSGPGPLVILNNADTASHTRSGMGPFHWIGLRTLFFIFLFKVTPTARSTPHALQVVTGEGSRGWELIFWLGSNIT